MDEQRLTRLMGLIDELRKSARELESELAGEVELVSPTHTSGARNLTHYLAVRQHDIRELQHELAELGLSSLGRLEQCVLFTLNAVDHALRRLARVETGVVAETPPTDFQSGRATLRANAERLLGPAPNNRSARIMVTLPIDADVNLIDQLVNEHTDIVRINCAKGGTDDWQRLVDRVAAAQQRAGRRCRIQFDLAGPNPRAAALRARETDVIARVSTGDCVLIAKSRKAARNARRELGKKLPSVGCTLPTAVADLKTGDRVYYDDGKIVGIVRTSMHTAAEIEVTGCYKKRTKIRIDKGFNFPDSRLRLPPLTEKDLRDLQFVAKNGDIVGFSFIRHPDDVDELQRELRRLNAEHLGIVLKIETMEAFNALPRLLLRAMRSPSVGLMVARGDMVLELGYERLAEAQEEILWLSEAALVPVIWATQVLERMNKTGTPARAEVTDAAMAGRAECVMLNQGDHTIETARFLGDVLDRMQAHQEKKRSMLRRLSISEIGSC